MLNHTLNRLGVELPVPLAELSITFRCRGYLVDLARLLETADSRYHRNVSLRITSKNICSLQDSSKLPDLAISFQIHALPRQQVSPDLDRVSQRCARCQRRQTLPFQVKIMMSLKVKWCK